MNPLHISAFYNPEDIAVYQNYNVVIDSNILGSLFSDHNYLDLFRRIFSEMNILIDPVVKTEFLRGAYAEDMYSKKLQFLEYEMFAFMAEHQEIYHKVQKEALLISRIHAHNGNQGVPLGDVWITARLSIYHKDCLFLTKDAADFQSILFDRCAVISVERVGKQKKNVLEHISLLQFNQGKYEACLAKLPKKTS